MKNTITGQKATKSTAKRRQKKVVIDEDDHLLEKGLRIVKVKGDGRCLFRALVRYDLCQCQFLPLMCPQRSVMHLKSDRNLGKSNNRWSVGAGAVPEATALKLL